MPLAAVQGDAWPFCWSPGSPSRLLKEHVLYNHEAGAAAPRLRTAFNEWQCPRWTGEMCPDGSELSCKRGSTGVNAKGLSCVKKRCVCKENSCYIAQTGQCVQDGCNVALAQVAAIQSVGGIGSPSAQDAALRAGHQIEEQSILQREWMPTGKASEEVRYLWSDKLITEANRLKEMTGYEGLKEALTKREPKLNKPITQDQVKALQEALTKEKGKNDLSDAELMEEFKYKPEQKVAYFWTDASKKWAVEEGKKKKIDVFDRVKYKHHVAVGQSVSKKQMEELQKFAPDGTNGEGWDWRKASDGKFEEDEIVKATYRWKNEGISVFKGDDFKKTYNDMTAVYGPLRGNSIVQDMAVKAFEDRYGTMDRANKGGRLFVKEDEVSKVADDDASLGAASNSPPQASMPRYQTPTPVIIARGSKTNNKELQDLASRMGNLSVKLENLAEHRSGEEDGSSISAPSDPTGATKPKVIESGEMSDETAARILGVEKGESGTYSKEEVRKKFDEISLTAHPDKGGDPVAYTDITKAYEVLKAIASSISSLGVIAAAFAPHLPRQSCAASFQRRARWSAFFPQVSSVAEYAI